MKLHEIKLREEEQNFIEGRENIVNFLTTRCELYSTDIKFAPEGEKFANLTNIIGDISMTGYNVTKFPKLKSVPLKFGYVTGEFDISHNEITSYEGCPQLTGKSFVATGNPVSSFEGITEHIGDSAYMADVKITSLVGIEKHIKRLGFNRPSMQAELMLPWKKITEGGIGLILIEGKFTLAMPGLTKETKFLPEQFKIIQKYIGRPNDLYECQTELIENGFEEFAKL